MVLGRVCVERGFFKEIEELRLEFLTTYLPMI